VAVCERDGAFFLGFCASAAVPAQSEMTMRAISDLIAEPFVCILKKFSSSGLLKAV